MPEFVNTMDVLGEGAVIDSIFKRTITELKDNRITKVGQYALYKCTALEEVDLPNATAVLGSAFYGCAGLTSVNLPKATYLEDSAFFGCKALTYMDFPSAETLKASLFSSCTALKTLILRSTSGVVTMGHANTLAYTAIANGEGYVYVPTALYEQYLTADKWSTYANQFRKLEEWTVDGTVTGELDLENRHMVRFFNYDGTLLSYVIVPHGGSATVDDPVRENASVAEDWQFTGWSPEPVNVTEDMDCVAQFKNNASMARAYVTGNLSGEYINDRITTTGHSGLRASKLTKIDFPNVTSIGEQTFWQVASINCVILRNETVVALGLYAFLDTPIASGTGYVYVPSALVDSYKSSAQWSAYANQIRAIEDWPDICGGE